MSYYLFLGLCFKCFKNWPLDFIWFQLPVCKRSLLLIYLISDLIKRNWEDFKEVYLLDYAVLKKWRHNVKFVNEGMYSIFFIKVFWIRNLRALSFWIVYDVYFVRIIHIYLLVSANQSISNVVAIVATPIVLVQVDFSPFFPSNSKGIPRKNTTLVRMFYSDLKKTVY